MRRHEDNRFDEQLKQKLGNYSTPMAPYIWDKVLEDVDIVDSSVSGWWKWAAAILFLLGFTAQLWIPSPNVALTQVEKFETIDPLSEQSVDVEKSAVVFAEESRDQDVQILGQSKSSEQKSTTVPILIGAELSEANSDGTERSASSNELEGNFEVIEIKPENTQNEESAWSIEAESTPETDELDIFTSRDSKAAKETQKLSEDNSLGAETQFTSSEEDEIEIIEEAVSASAPTGAIEVVDETIPSMTIESDEEILEGINSPLAQVDTPPAAQERWTVEFLAGPSVNYRVFHSDANPDLASHKNANDRSMLSTNLSILIRRQMNDKWSVATGVQAFNSGERYSYTINSETHDFDNAYNYLSIPLEVDYTFLEIEGFKLDFGVGAQYNHLREGTSSWVDLESEQAVTHSNKGKDSPFNKSAMAFNTDITARYGISPWMDVMAQPRGVLFTQSLYKEQTGLDQRPYAVSFMLGLAAKF